MRRRAFLSWLFVGLAAALCVFLGVLQYRWIGEVSHAERDTLREDLQANLRRLGQEFDAEINNAWMALLPPIGWDDGAKVVEVYEKRYQQWRSSGSHGRLFRRICLAERSGSSITLRELDLGSGAFHSPDAAACSDVRDRIEARAAEVHGPPRNMPPGMIDLPHMGRGGLGQIHELEWLIVDVDLNYVRDTVLPDLVQRHLANGRRLDYQIEVATRDDPSTLIYPLNGTRIGAHADASAGMFSVRYDQLFRRFSSPHGGPPQPTLSDPGRWLISARHRAGSLEAVVEQARERNLAVTCAVLLLMLSAIAALFRFTRRAQRLSQLQMDFVTGVSHELRTPLSVIRTAAHNLGGGVVSHPKQVQRYGALIEDEAGKLTAIVEQVLSFSSAEAGRAVRTRERVEIEPLIASAIADTNCEVEQRIESGLPPLSGDPTALKHALQNLLSNAAKYGAAGGWIGISASSQGDSVRIEVADRGAGIPANEIGQIFDPFYRGSKAVADQIHGTGLGLSLVKRIVEAHEGSVSVESEPGSGARFILNLPAAPA